MVNRLINILLSSIVKDNYQRWQHLPLIVDNCLLLNRKSSFYSGEAVKFTSSIASLTDKICVGFANRYDLCETLKT